MRSPTTTRIALLLLVCFSRPSNGANNNKAQSNHSNSVPTKNGDQILKIEQLPNDGDFVEKEHDPEEESASSRVITITTVPIASGPQAASAAQLIPHGHGEVIMPDLNMSLSGVSAINFVDLERNADGEGVIFEVKPLHNIPRPTIYSDSTIMNLPMISAVKAEAAHTWYGEKVGDGDGAATFMVDLVGGNIYGTIHDGTNSYRIQSADGADSKKVVYAYIHLKLQEQDVDRNSYNKDERRELESDSNLQGCKDIEGYYGKWYDMDGPIFSCEWYSEYERCTAFGDRFENFGFTANQACCSCGGGGGSTIDTMVVYTPVARVGAGGHNAIKNLIHLSIYQTNAALSNSGIDNVRFRVVHILEDPTFNDVPGIDYGEFLNPIANSTNDKFAHIHSKREDVGADIVVAIGENVVAGVSSSLGKEYYLMKKGFAEVRRDQAALSGHYLFAHEVGHIMGGHHHLETDTGGPRYSHGYIDKKECFHTIMSYAGYCDCAWYNFFDWGCDKRMHISILQYSNIKNSHKGKPAGHSEKANNARAIVEYAPELAQLKPSKIQAVELCKPNYHCTHGSYLATHLTGNFTAMPHELGNDGLSLVNIPRGLSFEYFEKTDFNGEHLIFGSQKHGVTLSMEDQNNIVKSFKVRQIPSGRVKMCKNTNCQDAFYASVGTWSSMPAELGSQISYVFVPRGLKLYLYQNNDFNGWEYAPPSQFNDTAVHLSHTDQIGSFMVSVW
mmetsp:Transcript_6118/g.17914  ORF Transcript_6118/g.17914 Transcript_6118/m.17914 type:complete len:728 (-) Transcript_6118:77-2260(-)